MAMSQRFKYKYLEDDNLNNKNVLILDSFISCMDKKTHNISIPTNISTLSYKCFCDCVNIKSLYIPPNISNIEKGAFYNCRGLEEIYLSENISELKDETFFSCASLKNINLSDKITSIGERCFFNCENLKEVNLSDNLEKIKKSAFKNCFSLTKVILPNSIKNLDENIFFNCITLEKIVLPNNISILESCLFANCKKLNNINIPENVDKIKDLVFFGCNSLSSIELPKNISYIGARAFSNCSSLKNIDLPDTISHLGQGIFSNCTNLSTVTLPNGLKFIPSSMFNNCSKLETVNIPKTTKQIDNSAFLGCSNLRDIELPKELQSIGSNAFSGCENLKSIKLPKNLKNIGTAAFYNCKTLSEINIPNSIGGLNPLTFYNCTNLKNIQLPKTFRRIPDSCFANCTNLDKINLPEELGFINAYAFSNCTSLKSLRLPKTIKAIKEHAFSNCTNLNKIIIPSKIKFISNSAFKNCPNIIICGEKNSYVHKYALNNNLKFEEYKFINLRDISLKDSFISMLNDEERKLDLILYPQNANDIFKVKWKSSDESIVSVNDGIIKSHGIGVATISASVRHNKLAKCIVSVELPLENISFESDSLNLNKNESKVLKLEYFPKNHTCTESPVWESSDENVAKVDSEGNITGINKGNCTITCTLDNKSTFCNVNVHLPLIGISLDATALNLKCGDTYKLNVSYIPSDATNDITLNWSCMDPSIISIDNDGTVKALKTGTTVVTVSANNKIATCIVTIKSSISQIKFKEDKINLIVDDSRALELVDENNNPVPHELVTWNVSDSNIGKIENNCVRALAQGTTVVIAQFENLIAACILNVLLKKVRLFDVNYLKYSSNVITGRGIEGATVKAYIDNKLISDICVIGSDKKFVLNIENQEPGSEIKVEISKNGYETREEIITALYEFDTFIVDSIETIDSNHINIVGKGVSESYIRAYIKNTQIGKAATVNSNGTFNLYLPKIKSDTVVTLKMRKTNYVTANKNIIIP